MELKNTQNQAIALAGVAQAAVLVQQLATTGTADSGALAASIGSILKIDSDSVIDVYGGLAGLSVGLAQLNQQMLSYKNVKPDQARYAATLVFLENPLSQRKDLLKIIETGVCKAQAQAESFGLMHENVLSGLAEVYVRTVSTLQPKIMVNGLPNHLSRLETADTIRACLLAGMRSVILWRQCGGRRWKLLFQRTKIQQELERLIAGLA